MADHDEMVVTFIDITQANPDHVRSFLESQSWNLENAIARFFDLGDRSISALADIHRQAEERERAESVREEEEEEEEEHDGSDLDFDIFEGPSSSSGGAASSPAAEKPDSKGVSLASGLGPNFGGMLTDRLFTDCILRVGPECVEIPAHRAVLSQFSKFFRDVFRSGSLPIAPAATSSKDVEMSDSKAPAQTDVLMTPAAAASASSAMIVTPTFDKTGCPIVELPDLSPEIVNEILTLMYTGKVQIPLTDYNTIVDLLLAAGRLEAAPIEEAFTKAVFATKETVGAVFRKVVGGTTTAKSEYLLKECLAYLEDGEENCEMLFDKAVTADIPLSLVQEILRSPTLPLTEIDVFRAALTWSEAQVEKSGGSRTLPEVFSSLKDCVGFSRMGFGQIRDIIHSSGIFTEDELLDLYGNAQVDDDEAPRSFKATNILEVHRGDVGIFGRSWSYSGTPDQIEFQVSEPIRLCGFGLFLQRGEFNITIRLYRGSEVINEHTQRLTCTQDRMIGTIYFRKPTVLEPGTRYIAYESIAGSANTPSLQNGRSPVTSHGVTFTYFTHSGSTNGTDVANGQIPIMYFKKMRS